MGQTFTDAQISKWANQYEREVCSKYPLIIDRYSLATIAGQSEYEIPNYIVDIRMVLYKGKAVYAKGFKQSLYTGDTPFSTATNAPYEYMVGGKGMRVIKFFPTVMDTISYDPNSDNTNTTKTLFDPAADTGGVVLEFYRTPSISDSTLRLPSWLRRWILKDFICSKGFAVEGPSQDTRGATYYENILQGHEQLFMEIDHNMHQINNNILSDRPRRAMRKPGHPILPPNFGFPASY